MLLSEPPTSPYDWHFSIFGFPVRVAWTFWIFTAALCYSSANYMSEMAGSPGLIVLLAISVGGFLVSILVHELGHAFAFRYFGIEAQIVLYHFGGLAIPGGYGVWSRQGRRRMDAKANILVAAAGPAAQLFLALIVGLIGWKMGYNFRYIGYLVRALDLPLSPGEPEILSVSLGCFLDVVVSFGALLALLNLFPVLPLDGGHIAQNVIGIFRGTTGIYEATVLSVVCGIVVGLYFLQFEQFFGLFLLVLGISNLQALQNPRGF